MAYENVTPPVLPDFSPVTGYSYNGVELPDIETVWTDKVTYPYGTITSANRFYMSTHPLKYQNNNLYPVGSGTCYCIYYERKNGGEWKLGNSGSLQYVYSQSPLWSNYDVVNYDNTTYLAASDPVPIQDYPYYVLVFNYRVGETDWYEAHLYYSDTAFTYDGSAVANTGNTFTQVASPNSDTWSGALSATPKLSPGIKGEVYQRIYTNHDILDSEGNVYLAAGEVTPVEEDETEETTKWAGLKSWLIGFVLGLAGKPLPLEVKREPVAYLYNGVALPKLPEWDRESYPYAAIGFSASYSAAYGYRVYFAMVDDAELSTSDGTFSTTGSGALYCVTDENGEWVGWKEVDGIAVADLLWANHDVLYTSGAGGTLYLAASDLVPVGETPPKRLKGYSYNGVILPAPPEYDAETYPYALIVYRDDLTTPVYEFFAYASDAEWDTVYNGLVIRFGNNAAYLYGKTYPTISTGVAPATWGWQESGESGNHTSKSKNVIWANFTGEYNGTVYWEASDEPTPIYV